MKSKERVFILFITIALLSSLIIPNIKAIDGRHTIDDLLPGTNIHPNRPADPTPANNSLDLELNVTLSVFVYDKNEDDLIVTFLNAVNDQLIDADIFESGSTATANWSSLNYDTKYSWYVIVSDGVEEVYSSIFYFTTKKDTNVINLPPLNPTNPSPQNNAKNVTINPTLNIYVEDPENDILNVDFYDANNYNLIGSVSTSSNSEASISWNNLEYGETYTWYVYVSDAENTIRSNNYVFTTKYQNNAPMEPANPYPENNAPNTKINIYLKIDVYDPDGDEILVYFYNNNDNSLIGTDTVISNGTASIIWSDLSYETTYSWYAVVTDLEIEISSDVYSFTTKQEETQEEENQEEETQEENEKGWIYGIVLIKNENITLPANSAKICIHSNEGDTITSSEIGKYCDTTSEKGEFYLYNVTPGNYTLYAVREINYIAETSVLVKGGKGIPVILTIDVTPTRMQIEKALEVDDVAGEVIIELKDYDYETDIILYEDISITNTELSEEKISLVVDGNQIKTSKIIVMTLDSSLIDISESVVVTYDGNQIYLADDLQDAVDPNNDGLQPECLIIQGASSIQIIISIPHFSQHEITIQKVVQSVTDIKAPFFYILACLIAATIFGIISYVRIRY